MARRIEQIQRNRGIRKTKKRILFEFEGRNKTEEKYFKNFSGRNKLYNIRFAYGNDTDPVHMIKSLITYMKREEINSKIGDKIYCVFDADFDVNKQKDIDMAKKIANENGIELIISNPSFELWYRLHFSYTKKEYNSNKELIEDLKGFIPEYEKNVNIYEKIKDKEKDAIENSKKLENEQLQDGKDLINIHCNPYTSVYKIIEYMSNMNE